MQFLSWTLSMHMNLKKQVTQHTIILCIQLLCFIPFLSRESLLLLTDNCCSSFLLAVLDYLKDERKTFLSKVFVFTDACVSQYKRPKTIADISLIKMTTEWNYFRSDQGKGDCDGIVGVLSNAFDRTIIEVAYPVQTQ